MTRGIPKEYHPSVQEVQCYNEKWKGLENYVNQERALDYLFFEVFPLNNRLEQVLLKIAVLNDFYSTNIFSVHTVAKHFMSMDIDARLQREDDTLVDDLSWVTMADGNKKHFFSFATKFCSHHKPLAYPIFDSYVGKVLNFFRRRDKFSAFEKDDLTHYPSFKQIISDFREYYGLQRFSFKLIDRYLWQLGKDYYKKQS